MDSSSGNDSAGNRDVLLQQLDRLRTVAVEGLNRGLALALEYIAKQLGLSVLQADTERCGQNGHIGRRFRAVTDLA